MRIEPKKRRWRKKTEREKEQKVFPLFFPRPRREKKKKLNSKSRIRNKIAHVDDISRRKKCRVGKETNLSGNGIFSSFFLSFYAMHPNGHTVGREFVPPVRWTWLTSSAKERKKERKRCDERKKGTFFREIIAIPTNSSEGMKEKFDDREKRNSSFFVTPGKMRMRGLEFNKKLEKSSYGTKTPRKQEGKKSKSKRKCLIRTALLQTSSPLLSFNPA